MNHGKLEVKHYLSESQLADILTKGLKIDRLLSLRKKLGIIQFDLFVCLMFHSWIIGSMLWINPTMFMEEIRNNSVGDL